MKVELQNGDRITIPEGYKAIVKDGSVIFEKIQEFKDGDILTYANYSDYRCPFIYKNTDTRGRHQFYVGVNSVGRIILSDNAEKRWGDGVLQHATEEEKQLLFDKMKKQGLWWNAEEKKVEKIRWRAPEKCRYWYCTVDFNAVKTADYRYELDHRMHKYGNYFRTEKQAQEAASRVKETLRNYHEEIGE